MTQRTPALALLTWGAILAGLAGFAPAAEVDAAGRRLPPDGPAADPLALREAEARILRATVDRQQREIAALRARVAELTAQVESLGVAPAGAATRPAEGAEAARRPKRIVFVLDYYGLGQQRARASEEVLKAVGELAPDQWFNVVYRRFPHGDPVALQKAMLPAGPKGVEQLRQLLGRVDSGPDALPAVALALQWKPDLIWYVGVGSPHPDPFLAEVAKLNAGAKVRINTTVQFLPATSGPSRFLWQLAHDSGGGVPGGGRPARARAAGHDEGRTPQAPAPGHPAQRAQGAVGGRARCSGAGEPTSWKRPGRGLAPAWRMKKAGGEEGRGGTFFGEYPGQGCRIVTVPPAARAGCFGGRVSFDIPVDFRRAGFSPAASPRATIGAEKAPTRS